MEALLAQFALLSDQALHDKSFDPATIEQLMELFEQEAYYSWAAMEADGEKSAEEAEILMEEAEEYLDSLMDAAMKDFENFEKYIDASSKAELESLVRAAKTAKKNSESIANAMASASKKYMNAALLSASASMKSARNRLSNASSKVHPS